MSGYPAHKTPIDRGAEAIWNAIKRTAGPEGLFCIADLQKEIGATRDTLYDWMKRLERGNHVILVGTLPNKAKVWRLPKTFADEAPRLKRDGTSTTPARRPENGNARLWRSMRMLKKFTARELTISTNGESAKVRLETAKSYLTTLKKAGYVRLVGTGANSSWVLIKNPGPRSPQIQRDKHVFDPNTDERIFIGGHKDE